ncbi:MAG: glycosyltransferase family 4 protein, partial [Candidatus Syntropharchaeia archaeon]
MVSMAKITLVTIQYPPTIGGLQVHVKGIVKLIETLGHEVHVITSEPNPTMKIDGNVDEGVIQLPVIKWFKDSPIIDPFKTYRALTKINPDIVHVVYPFPLSLDVACIYTYLNHKKLVCTYIDDIIVEFPYSMIIKVYEKIFWKICKRTISSMSVSSHEYGKNATGLKDWKKQFYDVPPPIFDTDFNLTLDKKYDAKKRLGLDGYDK